MGHLLKDLILQLVGFNTALSLSFNVTCPEGVLRKLRSKIFCADEKQYHCMYDTLKHAYVETCIPARPIGEGQYSVLSGNLDIRECHQSFYSPFAESPVLSNDGHMCYFLKSFCNEEGQVTVSNGSPSADRLCRCDYTRGYDYVTKPKDACKCSPSTEDCSCFTRLCSRRYDILNQDYECEDGQKEKYICGAIINQRYKKEMPTDSSKETCSDCNSEFTFEQRKHVTVLLLSVITVLLILAVCSVSVLMRAELLQCHYESCADAESKVEGIYYPCCDMEVVNYYVETKQIDQIQKAFKSGDRDKLIILRGIPGSGKTQAAHYYCQQEERMRNYSLVAKIVAKDSYSLFDTLKDLAHNIRADILPEEGDRKLTIKILCHNIKKFLNETCRATLHYLFLVDNARLNDENCNLKYVLSLVSEVKNLDMIVTTYDSRFEKNYKSVVIEFNGMEKEEYTNLLKRNEKGSLVEISEESIDKLISQIGKIPIVINSARQYLITTRKSVRTYLDTFKDLEPIDKFILLHFGDNICYENEILDSLRIPLRDVKHNVKQRYGEVLWEAMLLLPFLCYDSVSTTVLEACYFHLPNSITTTKKFKIDSLIMECERFSLCYVIKAQKSKFKFSGDYLDMSQSKNTEIRYLTFHEVTMTALGLIDDDRETLSDKYRHFEFLLKMFCFEIDIDARTDKTLQRNILFLPHARKLLRQIDKSNVAETDEILFYKSYLHCAIGSTFLFQKTDIGDAHIHLVKSRCICLKIVGDKSYFTKAACIFQQVTSETVRKPTPEDIKTVAELVFQKEFDRNFVQNFVLGMRRSLNDVEAIKRTTELQLKLFNGHYLQIDEYESLIDKYAIPMDSLGKILLGELLLRILINNGRVLNEFLFSIGDRDRNQLQVTCNTEFHNANEFCELFKKQYPDHKLFACLENDRTGRMLMRCSETSIETDQIDNDIAFYKNMIDNPFDRCFNFGVLKMSRCFNDCHICMCLRILIKFLQLKYEHEHDGSKKVKIFAEGKKEVELLQEKFKQMIKENRHHTWLTLPLFHIQCAKFLLLSHNSEDTEKALELFEKATKLEESRGVFWTRYIHEGYHGSLLCLQKLERHNEADKLVKTIEEKYSSITTKIRQIKNLEYKRWC